MHPEVSARTSSATRAFPAEPACVAVARTWAVEQCLAAGVGSPACDAVRLLVSELVTNVVAHTGSRVVVVRIRIEGTCVEVDVEDDDARRPLPRHAGPDDTGGRGLALLAAAAHDWGVRTRADGKTVWFRVDDTSRADLHR